MKKLLLIAVTACTFCLFSFIEINPPTSAISTFQDTYGRYTKEQAEKFIREVFTDKADELVFNSDSGRLKILTDFLSRVRIEHKPEYKEKKFRRLSEIELQNKYNPALTRDENYDPATFNPIKYKFVMTATTRLMYRIGNTDYIIFIDQVK